MEEPSLIAIIVKLGVVLLLVLANGYFVAAEFAIVSVRKSRIDSLAAEGNKRALAVQRILTDVTAFISSCQFGITVASLVLGWLGEETIAELLAPPLEHLMPGSISALLAAHTIATALSLAIVTYLHLLLGEFVPKAVALERAETVSLAIARPMELFYRIFKAPIWLINKSGILTLKMLGLQAADEHSKAYSEEELRQLIALSQKSGHVLEDERRLIDNIFDFSDTTVESIMIPRTEIEAVDADLSSQEMLDLFEHTGYSRMPVYRGTLDNVLGIMLHKDLSRLVRHSESDISRIIRTAVFLPTSAKLNTALRSLRRSSAHMAMVVDEHGGVEGMVTLEDILEEIVGEIQDEHDEAVAQQIVKHPDNSISVNARLSIKEANRQLDLNLPESESYHTVAGFMMARAGRLLKQGESIDFNGLKMTVEAAARNRILQTRIVRPEPENVAEQSVT